MWKKLLVLMMSLVMVLSFAACGGGGGESAPAEPETPAAEPNAGAAGIVITIPDGWELSSFSENSSATFRKSGSDLQLGIGAVTEEEFTTYNLEDAKTLQEFYEKYYQISKEAQKERNIEVVKTKVCDCDADYSKRVNGDGYSLLATTFMCDNAVYEIFLSTPDAVDWSNNGMTRESAPVFSDEDVAMYESVVASAQKGDGNAILKEQTDSFTVNSIGSMAFEAPATFKAVSVSDTYITFKKDGSDAEFYINLTRPEDLSKITYEDGSHPESIEAYYERNIFEGIETEKIGGFDGYINKYPDEDGKYYNVGGGFLGDDGVYDFTMDANAYDWENDGALKEGAQPLSEEDIAGFDNFIASLKKK